MDEANKEAPEREPPEKVKQTILWDAEDWRLLEEAAQKLGQETHLDLAPLQIIRSGALLRARAILGLEAAA